MKRCRKARKRGSVIVESAITLPFFLIAILVLCSIILMYSSIEGCSFIAANQIRRASAEAIYVDSGYLLPYRIKKEASENYSMLSDITLVDYGYREDRWNQDELIFLKMKLELEPQISLAANARAEYELSVVSRAYVGKVRGVMPMSYGEMSGNDVIPVYIFPAKGIRYHEKNCDVLHANYSSGILDSSVQNKYKTCPICNSKNAGKGSKIYFFPSAGEAYHLEGCPSLQRKYIEIDLMDAVNRGYTPCMKCGGN